MFHQNRVYGGCDKTPRYNVKGSTPIYCKEHASVDMINVVDKKCIEEGCPKTARFNTRKEKTPLYCRDHRTIDMVDVRRKECIVEDCEIRRPTYGLPGYPPTHCYKHKKDGLIRNPTTKCKPSVESVCKETALYGVSKAVHCERHKLDGELNLIERECKGCNLPNIVDVKGYCRDCHPDSFKNFRLAKQRKVENFLNVQGPIPDSVDKIFEGGVCGRERIDFLYDCNTHFIVLEVDENQHMSRLCECEQTRMINIFNALALPVWFIRYNPDEYRKKDGKKRIVGDTDNKRHALLKEWLDYCIENNPLNEETSAYSFVVHLYFDEWDGVGEKNILVHKD